jgi:ABC-type phosphate transport system substrate-binding protein
MAWLAAFDGYGRGLPGYLWVMLRFEDQDAKFKSKHVFPSSGPLEKTVELNPNAIGVTGHYQAVNKQIRCSALISPINKGSRPNNKFKNNFPIWNVST